MKTFYKPTMLFIYFLLAINYSCNNEELFVEESVALEEETLSENEDIFQNIIIKDDIYTTNQNTFVIIKPSNNDEYVPADFILTYTSPSAGVLSIDNNNTPNDSLDDNIIYTPEPGFNGVDFFEYTICETSNLNNCDSGIVTINVNAIKEDGVAKELKAFPSAYGTGAGVTGGRGGKVIHVTTLNWTGAGSLKEALQTTGARTIVFDVSGEIDATSQGDYSIICRGASYDNLTIAGQTAPTGGITILTNEFSFLDVSNISIRFIRFRGDGFGQDSAWFHGGKDIIMDHCTFSHGGDEAFSVASSAGIAMGNVTIQNCFFQDSKTGTILGTDNSEGDFTFINNVFSSVSHRFPNPKGNGQYDIINNVVYNWKNRLIRISYSGTYNIMNNYYKPSVNGLRSSGWYGSGTVAKLQKLQTKETYNPLIYTSGNIVTGQRDTPLLDDSDMWQIFDGSHLKTGDPVPSQYFTNNQFPLKGKSFTIKTAEKAYIDVLNDVGANKTLNSDGSINYYQDNKDAADILMIKNDTYNGSFYDKRSSIAYPEIPKNRRESNYDSDNDGMPDLWEKVKFNDLSRDGNGDEDGDGYTDLEEFLNLIDS